MSLDMKGDIDEHPLASLNDPLQSQILSTFCDGKSMSTFFIVLRGNQIHRPFAFDVLRDALVDRYKNLARTGVLSKNMEVRDCLDVIREDIRTCGIIDSDDGTLVCDDDEYSDVVAKVSQWCAIVDYFDSMKSRSDFVLWAGPIQTQGFGKIESASVSSPFWTVTALDYFYQELELNNHYLTHPSTNGLPSSLVDSPFGMLKVDTEGDVERLGRVQYSLSSDPDSGSRFALVPSQQEYEPTFCFALPSGSSSSYKHTLALFWEGEDDIDFEYSLRRIGENVIRLLSRLELS
uniref:Uncharacterized protein n=1 Tax=Odontella aurita TaxID=265563 RepID=A0A7S4MVZ8_9STRA|mmetsp:Transcript_34492/g.103140  ORF Transcript_34492/g.103140 Transcript_34492/m.103140 type:complete len:291 (+) Transcript_34492:83-955(+)